MTSLLLRCCGCQAKVDARLTNGAEIYPHRSDLAELPFWKCDDCGNHVGCHHKTGNPTQPLGIIPTSEIRNARQHIHKILDPLWQSGPWHRKALYSELSKRLGWKYHTAAIRSVEEARTVYRHVVDLVNASVADRKAA